MPTVSQWGQFLLCLGAFGIGIWLTVETEWTLSGRGRRALEVSPSLVGTRLQQVKVLEAESVEGLLATPVQPNIHYLGPLTHKLDFNEHDVESVKLLTAENLEGVVGTPTQSDVTVVGVLSNDLQMGGFHVTAVNHLTSLFLVGALLDPVQSSLTGLGPMRSPLNLNGHALVNIRMVLDGAFNGELPDAVMLQIEEMGDVDADLNVNGQDLKQVYEVVRGEVESDVVWGCMGLAATPSGVAYGSDPLTYGVAIHPTDWVGGSAEGVYVSWSVADPSVGAVCTFLVSGYYSFNIRVSVAETKTTECGWMRNGGSPTVLPSQQSAYMLGLVSTPATGLSRYRELPTVVHYFLANDSVMLLVANSDGTRPTLLNVEAWQGSICFVY